MSKVYLKLAGLGAAALLGLPAQAAIDCNAGTLTATFTDLSTASYVACSGTFESSNTLNGTLNFNDPDSNTYDSAYAFSDKSDEAPDGLFNVVPNGASGTITFDLPVGGLFALGLKAANDVSYYVFDGGTLGITSIAFNTLGVSTNKNGIGNGLSHATLYGGAPVPAIPEPETYALMLAGLAAVGFMARRRRRQV